jgi:hypothetical protein
MGFMETVLASAGFVLSVVRALIDAAWVRDNLYLKRPDFAARAAARRLASSLRYIEAYLRRVLVVIALEIEPMLVDDRGPMRRPHGKKANKALTKPPCFTVLNGYGPPLSETVINRLEARADACKPHSDQLMPQPVAMERLYLRLDHLAAIVRDPLARAKRLAFHLARSKEGPIVTSDPAIRPPSHWKTDARATFVALGYDMTARSMKRPPPLGPRRRCWPTIIRL